MTEIAELIFSAQTKELQEATIELNKVRLAAQGLEKSSLAAKVIVEKSAAIIAKAETQLAREIYNKTKATKTATEAEIAQAKVRLNAAREDEKRIEIMRRSISVAHALEKANLAVRASETGLSGAAGVGRPTPVTTRRGVGGIANDQLPNRFNTSNIAAQFQDIAVTASMGMNPLLVAMQQGTQVAAIMNSMKNPLQGLAAAFTQVINPVSILSIALTGLAVVGLQMVDWPTVGANALGLLADSIQYLAPLVVALGAALIALNWSAVVSGVTAATVGIGSLTVAAGAATLAFVRMAAAWVITPIGALTTAVGLLAGGLAYVYKVFDKAGDAVRGWADDIRASKGETTDLTDRLFKQTVELYNQIEAMKLHGVARRAYIIEQEEVNRLIDENIKNGKKATDGLAERLPIIKSSAMRLAEMQAVSDKLRESENKRNKTTKESTKIEVDHYEKLIEGTNSKIAALENERIAIGLSGKAAAEHKYQTELLNEANSKGIELGPQEIETLTNKAKVMAELSVANDNYREGVDFAKSASKSFITDMISGLSSGKSAWESFGNSVLNILNKIFDKLINSGLETLFGGDGGLSSVAGGFFGDLFGASSGSSYTDMGNFNADLSSGFSFSQGLTGAYAKGGAFTNGIYNSPTMFRFAGGGKFGLMGEAGPEAVMPLKRGADGSLGVALNDAGSGASGNGNVVVNVYNNSDSSTKVEQRQTSQGVEIDVMIDRIVSEKLGTQGTATNHALNTYQQRRLITR